MSEFIGEVRAFAGELPDGWLPCDGTERQISRYQPLFSVIATRFGGDGISKFALPDLRGMVVAGTDRRDGTEVGDTSGHGGEDASLIPFEAVRWGICAEGEFPLER